MGFHHRKLCSEDKSHKPDKGLDPCNFCYNGCPVECKNTNILPTSSPPSSKHQIPTNLILMLCILAAAFMFLVCLAVRRYRWSSRNSRTIENANNREVFTDENQSPAVDHPIWYIRTVGLQQSVIDSIAVFKYEKGQGLTDCSVCLNEFQEAENLRVLPKCSHAFHLPCVDTWLRTHQNCPVCRAPIVGNADTSPANSALANSNDLGSREEARVDNELDQRVVETDETRAGIENEQPIQIEDGKLADLSHTK